MIKLKDFLKVIPKNTLVEITYYRKNRPTVVEMIISEYAKFQNQYIVEDVTSYHSIIRIKVRERRKR